MITLLIVAIAFAALFFVAFPVVTFALMLETCNAPGTMVGLSAMDEEPLTVRLPRLPLRAAA